MDPIMPPDPTGTPPFNTPAPPFQPDDRPTRPPASGWARAGRAPDGYAPVGRSNQYRGKKDPNMATTTGEVREAVPWRKVHALGLPGGSVRALLALIVFATIWALLALKPDRAVPPYLRDLLFIILGHYFATRRRSGADDPDGVVSGPPPLFLPKGTIRFVSILGFLGVAILLQRRGDLLPIGRNPASVTLVLVGGFLFGVIMAQVWAWLREGGLRPPRFVEDVRALIALAAAVVLVVLVWDTYLGDLGPNLAAVRRLEHIQLEEVLAAVVGFYFGSRS